MEKHLIEELTAISTRMIKGYDTLKKIGKVEIAVSPKTAVYHEDKLTLYRYDRDSDATYKTPVLIIYALVNTYKMLDLQPDRSYIKNLLEAGLDVYLIDWGFPDQNDRYISLDDYVNGYINNCVDHIRKKHRLDSINILSICQGGTLSVIYSSLYPNKVKNLVTHVTPVDFSTNDGLLFRWSKDTDFDLLVEANHGVVPGKFLNDGFDMLKPMMKVQKQQALTNSLDDQEKLLNFLRMEKWISESPDQAGACFLQFMKDLYQGNKLVKGTLEVGGKKVNLKNLKSPLLNIYATEDHLVPPAATIPLNEQVGSTDKELYSFKGGHIGVFVGSRSQKELAPAVTSWLKKKRQIKPGRQVKATSLNDIKKELQQLPVHELADLCVALARYKQDNKEYLGYLMFESHNKAAFVQEVKQQVDELFEGVGGHSNLYDAKKDSVKILRQIAKYCRYLNDKALAAELYIYFCNKVKDSGVPVARSKLLLNLYQQQLIKINALVGALHEDLRADYNADLENIAVY